MRRREPTPGPHCPKCGYSLYGLPQPRCPECGTVYRPPVRLVERQDWRSRYAPVTRYSEYGPVYDRVAVALLLISGIALARVSYPFPPFFLMSMPLLSLVAPVAYYQWNTGARPCHAYPPLAAVWLGLAWLLWTAP